MASREPLLKPVPISELRPTQMTVGLREVAEKRRRWQDYDAEKKRTFLGAHMIPTLLGPKKHHYVIDHHHLSRALHEEGVEEVLVTVGHTNDRVTIVIEDDGEGYAADILQRIGDPYVTKRQRDERAGGLGLGLFIAKTLLERSGAKLTFGNRTGDKPGARVSVEWPRARMDANLAK